MIIIEVWKDIPNYDGQYQVSNYGNVRSKKFGDWKNLSVCANNLGYGIVRLTQNRNPKSYFAHRLVAQSFIPNPDNFPEVNHIDENKMNNHVDNLEWCTSKYNMNHGTARDRMLQYKRKSILQYDMDMNLVREWISQAEASRSGFSQSEISSCCLGKVRQHKGYIWRFKDGN